MLVKNVPGFIVRCAYIDPIRSSHILFSDYTPIIRPISSRLSLQFRLTNPLPTHTRITRRFAGLTVSLLLEHTLLLSGGQICTTGKWHAYTNSTSHKVFTSLAKNGSPFVTHHSQLVRISIKDNASKLHTCTHIRIYLVVAEISNKHQVFHHHHHRRYYVAFILFNVCFCVLSDAFSRQLMTYEMMSYLQNMFVCASCLHFPHKFYGYKENGQRMSIVKISSTHAENGDTMLVQFVILVTIITVIFHLFFHPSSQRNKCIDVVAAWMIYIYALGKLVVSLRQMNAAKNTNGVAPTHTNALFY